MVRKDLEEALKAYNAVSEYYNKGLDQLMATIEYILTADRMAPVPKPEWPVSYEAACDVVSGLHDQLDEAHNKITELEAKLFGLKGGV
jgi:hypothetical protein